MRATRDDIGHDVVQWDGSNMQEVIDALEMDALGLIFEGDTVEVPTRSGIRRLEPGGWIIKDPAGGLLATDDRSFCATYAIEEEE